MSKLIMKAKPHLNFANFLATSASIGGVAGSAIRMNEDSRREDATLGTTFLAGLVGATVGFIGGAVVAISWPIGIAAVGFSVLNRPRIT